jgi:hypothetical protein
MYNNVAAYDQGMGANSPYSSLKPMPGEQSEDLYFYQRRNVSLKKGERASYSVFEASVPYEHVYRWDINNNVNVDDRGYRRQQDSDREVEQQVWHVLRLENRSKQPWTTAPAFTVKGQSPLAQDTLKYTPSGATSTLRLTVATDMRAEESENEISRRVENIQGRSYEEVIVQGKLKVTSWKDKAARLIVHKTFTGEAVGETGGKVNKVMQGMASLNPNSEVEWEFMLEANKAKELAYSYKFLIQR